jgi:MYXO-CTERM domain-containing protein
MSDTNTALYLTMDRDYVVEAVFSCSPSSGVLPPLAMGLLLLALGVVVRRLS